SEGYLKELYQQLYEGKSADETNSDLGPLPVVANENYLNAFSDRYKLLAENNYDYSAFEDIFYHFWMHSKLKQMYNEDNIEYSDYIKEEKENIRKHIVKKIAFLDRSQFELSKLAKGTYERVIEGKEHF